MLWKKSIFPDPLFSTLIILYYIKFSSSLVFLIDYLEMSENQINSLMMRYDTLHATNESLVADLEGNAAMVGISIRPLVN